MSKKWLFVKKICFSKFKWKKYCTTGSTLGNIYFLFLRMAINNALNMNCVAFSISSVSALEIMTTSWLFFSKRYVMFQTIISNVYIYFDCCPVWRLYVLSQQSWCNSSSNLLLIHITTITMVDLPCILYCQIYAVGKIWQYHFLLRIAIL